MSVADRDRIRSHIDPELDEFNGSVVMDDFQWKWPNWLRPKVHMTKDQASDCQKYINFIVRRDYPYQVREYMGRHIWLEFCEYWSENPDFDRSMRYL